MDGWLSKYDIACGGSEFESGSNGKVLKNELGIPDPARIGLVETQLPAKAQEAFYDDFETEHSFTIEDLCEMHRRWLGDVDTFAGTIQTAQAMVNRKRLMTLQSTSQPQNEH